jgi:alpha-L-fucosidase
MYKASWNSIQAHEVPQWLKDAKFGIYTHWGVYSVPACGPNATWYGYNMYREGSLQYNYHVRKYGDPSVFGYKDFIPMFTAEKFDAEEWAELFRKSGAKFAGPVGEHHEGFTMWDTKYSKWNAARMGPKRDVVGELEKAVRREGLRFMTAMHHAETWWFYPHWKTQYDVADPAFSGLYGEIHDMQWAGQGEVIDRNPYVANHEEFWPTQQKPSKQFLDLWLNKLKELVDNYSPDLLWFDFGLRFIQEHYKKEFVAYYYNKGKELGKDFIITYKWHNLAPGSGVEDIEQGKREDLTYNFWITDTTADDGEAWGYLYNNSYKSPTSVIHYLIDNVSKNGALLLSIGPTAEGVIPDEVRNILAEMGKWLEVNGEAIYGASPWMWSGEGPTKMIRYGPFCEADKLKYTARDFRFTVRDDSLYAICLGWPGNEAVIETIAKYVYPEEIQSVKMLGLDRELEWKMTSQGLKISVPCDRPCDHAYTFKIERKRPF